MAKSLNCQSSKSPPRPGFPASPCVDVCRLADDDVCIGCARTIREISEWSRMSSEQQWRVVRELPARKASRGDPE